MATRRWWLGALVLCGVTSMGCATGQNADPDADGVFDDVDQKAPVDTGKKGGDAGEVPDVVAVDDVPSELDAGPPTDLGGPDAGTMDLGATDSGTRDSGAMDSGAMDVGPPDTGPRDTGVIDTGVIDTGPRDTGVVDTGPPDTGVVDTGPVDTGVGPSIMCVGLLGSRTCRGSDACCIIVSILPPACGHLVPIFGCLPL